jgi:hypothetical protein
MWCILASMGGHLTNCLLLTPSISAAFRKGYLQIPMGRGVLDWKDVDENIPNTNHYNSTETVAEVTFSVSKTANSCLMCISITSR